ncbi:MAG: glycerophosphodiester phosphodiesterase [Pirellulales bacterium]|nr:glycerophosphodiester phosphodiesterase [Pirellulales bacterium]
MMRSILHSLVGVVVLGLALAAADSARGQFIVAHRGASHDAPENTLAAFKLAFEQGADGVEGDFYLTSDSKIICCHDRDTERTAGVKHVIKETAFDVLRSLDVGAWKDEKYRGERMPTLEEAIAVIPQGKMFFIELKTGPEIVAPLVATLKKSPLELEQIVIICFNEKTIAECERQWPELRCHWLTGYKKDEQTGEYSPTEEQVEQTLERMKCDGLGSDGNPEQFDADFIKELCADGWCEFHVWTIDEADVARYYQKLGTWSITTNRPGWLRKQLWPNGAPQATVGAAAAK